LNWFVCIISKKPFLEWEIEKFVSLHPHSKSTIIKKSLYFAFDCPQHLLYSKSPDPEDISLKFVFGRGYLAKSTGYATADASDWDKLCSLKYTPADIDGHYIALKLSDNYIQVTNDIYDHYPIYFSLAEDYFIVSNLQYFITALLSKKEFNFAGLSNLTLLDIPLERKTLYTNIMTLSPGSTLTYQRHQLSLKNRAINYITEAETDPQKYLFAFRRAFELQLNDHSEKISLPFENNHAARFAFTVWYPKPSYKWGMHYLNSSKFNPNKHLDPFILDNISFTTIPDLIEPRNKPLFQTKNDYLKNLIWDMYQSYVLATGMSDFPEFFPLAGHFKDESDTTVINLLSEPSEWLFEKSPIERTYKMYNLLVNKKFAAYKKIAIPPNHFWHKDFYASLLVGAELAFKDVAEKTVLTGTTYDQYHFFVKNYQINRLSTGIGWLNNYRLFYSPGMLYSLTCGQVKQSLQDKKFPLKTANFYLECAPVSKDYPKPFERKNIYPQIYHRNNVYFPHIAEKIATMIVAAENVPLYNIPKLHKIFKKSLSGNADAIAYILKWTAFEIFREYLY